MKLRVCLVLSILMLGTIVIPGAEEAEVEEEKTMVVTFKGMNVYEYSVSLIFVDADSNEILFSHFDIALDDYEFYFTDIDEESLFPEYRVNPENAGREYKITYVEREVEGEFSGEMEKVFVITNIELVPYEIEGPK